MPSPTYCTQNNGSCATCALSSYGRDCQGNAISPNPEQVKDARVKAGLTQEQAGAIVGAPSRRTWQDWEAGRRNMPAAKWELFLLKTQK
jgi:DNA-binding XRE family transcriptional regulator